MTVDARRLSGAERTVAGRGRSATPQVTVVVIVHDDALALPVAVRSALDQSLTDLEVIVVDDASSDESAAVAEAIAATDERVRVLRRSTNSGGCSAPRNDGLAAARGRWVMFLDSDDELFPDAAAFLISAGERTGAEIASGRLQRFHMRRRAVTPWYPELYRHERVVGGLRDLPDLLHDALSTNKAYRRAFLDRTGLRFVEGIHYEDQVFSMSAYLSAARIVLVPHEVYRWNVREANHVDGRLSITNRRAEIANLRSRLEANTLIDALVDASGAMEVRVAKDVKFVKHDLRLYLNDLWERDTTFRSAFMGEVGDYLKGLDEQSWDALPVLNRVAAALIVSGNLDAVLDAVEALRRPMRLPVPLGRRNGRLLFGAAPPVGEESLRLDVTDSALRRAPRSAARLESVRRAGDALELRLVVRHCLLLEECADDVPAVTVSAARFGLRRLAVPLSAAQADAGPGAGLCSVIATLEPAALRLLPGPLNAWRLRVLVDGKRLAVGRPHLWGGPVHVDLGADGRRGQQGVLSYNWVGDLGLVAEGSSRLEEQLLTWRLRLRHTGAGAAFRASKAMAAAVRRALPKPGQR